MNSPVALPAGILEGMNANAIGTAGIVFPAAAWIGTVTGTCAVLIKVIENIV